MRVVAKHPRLSSFWAEHPDAEVPLLAWYKNTRRAEWRNFADVRRDYGAASSVGEFVVFNIGGNKYRLAVKIAYRMNAVFVHRVMTHKEYDRGNWKEA